MSASREGLRTYARGRAYDPNRYPITPYVDPNGPAKPVEEEPAELSEEEKQVLSESAPELMAQAETAAQQASALETAGEPDDAGDYEEAYADEDGEQ